MEKEKFSLKAFCTKKKYKKAFRTVIVGLIAVLCTAIVLPNIKILSQRKTYTYESVSQVKLGKYGKVIAIDNGKKTVVVSDGNGRLLRRIDGGTESAPFYYAAHAEVGSDGCIYVADLISGNRGNLIDRERIIRIGRSKSEVIHEFDYTDVPDEETPLQYGRILELQEKDGVIRFVYADSHNAQIWKISSEGSAEVERTYAVNGELNDASYDVSTGTLVLAYRTGEITVIGSDNKECTVSLDERSIPWDVSARGGAVYFTEVIGNRICRFFEESPEEIETVSEHDYTLFKLDSDEEGNIYATDYVGYLDIETSEGIATGESEYIEELAVSYVWAEILIWGALGIGALCYLYVILVLAIRFVRYLSRNEQALRITFIILASLIVAAIISYTLLKRILSDNMKRSEEKANYFTDIILDQVDGDLLEQIKNPEDFDGEAFRQIRKPLDEKIVESYENGDYYYYVIYEIDGDSISLVIDYERSMTCFTPVYPADTEPYCNIFETGEREITSENSAYGAWTFVLEPIYDSAGDIIAILEVGQSLDAINREQAALTREIIINSEISTIVVAMLLLELTFLLSFTEKRRKIPLFDQDPTDKVAVRTMMFLSYLMDSMQDAFIVLLCTQLYKGGLPVSDGVAVALPMSGQLFMMAIASFFVGRLTEKVGTKNTMMTGVLLQLSGCVVCLVMGNYIGILIGKMLIGAGMGMIYVSCNTVAAMGATTEKAGEAFAGVSAGTLSGLTIGAGLSSVLLSLGGWKLIYASGIGIMVIAFIIAALAGDARPGKKEGDISVQKDINFFRFLFNPRILPFFLMILLPFMISLSFREYFFPIIAEQNGVGESKIGQIYLLCGMGVLYLGPFISSWMLKKLGAYWSIVVASAGMAGAMVLYVVYPSFVSVVIGVVVLSLVISFAYTCQYTYFELLPECGSYGEGNAMGVYSVFESAGQTLGPITYGLFIGLGYRNGILTAMAILLALTIIFVVISRSTAKLFR